MSRWVRTTVEMLDHEILQGPYDRRSAWLWLIAHAAWKDKRDGDFAALMLTVRPEDLAVPGNAGYNGAYPLAYYSTASFNAAYQYFGIRRQPFSRSFAFNSLTFQQIGRAHV